MGKSETLNPAEAGDSNSLPSTEKLALSPEVESKWHQLRDYDTDSAWVRSCMINDPESWGKIKRYYMLQKALFGPTESMDRAYKSFVDNHISGFTDIDCDRMAMICARAKMSMPFTDVEIDDTLGCCGHAYRIFKRMLGDQFVHTKRTLNACLGNVIVVPISRPQTVYGYRELPIVIVPSLENIWDLLVLVHELAHAIHLRISSKHNDMDKFVPDKIVAETIANSFQFAALKYIADKWSVETANHMWDMLLLFGLDDNVHYSKKKATLFGLSSAMGGTWSDDFYSIMKNESHHSVRSLLGFLTGRGSEGGAIKDGLKIAESKKVF